MEFRLIIKKLNGTLSKEELHEFNEWYESSLHHKEYFTKVQLNYNKEEVDIINLEKAWQKINDKTGYIEKRKKIIPIWRYTAGVAVILLFLGITLFFIIERQTEWTEPHRQKAAEAIALPGRDKAILTIESGKQIVLEKGKELNIPQRVVKEEQLVYNEGKIKKKENIKWNYVTIPKGGQFHLKLSDGTQIWLNSDTKLKYPVQFVEGKVREVELLYGEAFFDVAPDTTRTNSTHFIVRTSMQRIEVLGTEFNIEAYKEEATTATTLVKGRVTVTDGITQKILKPNEQARYNKDYQRMEIRTVNAYDEISWRRGEFSFTNKPLEDIAKVLARWYDIDIVIENAQLKKTTFNGVLSKDQDLKSIFETINKTNPLSYTVNEGKVVLR